MGRNMRVLVTGGRNFGDRPAIYMCLSRYDAENPDADITLVSGACPTGADKLCEEIASELGWSVETHPADWGKHGKSAGPIRNQGMVDLGADFCFAFPDVKSRGTWHCVSAAKKAGIPVHVMS